MLFNSRVANIRKFYLPDLVGLIASSSPCDAAGSRVNRKAIKYSNITTTDIIFLLCWLILKFSPHYIQRVLVD